MTAVTTKKIADKSLLAKDELAKYEALTSIAAKVRFMLSLNKSRGDISRFMTEKEGKLVRYQWVRNIELTPLKKVEG
jgi:hypothetical protein